MGLSAPVTLPVSALNIGLTAGLPVIALQIADINGTILGLEAAIAGSLTIVVPTLVDFTAAIAASINLPAITAQFTAMAALSVDLNASILIDLGLINIAISVVARVVANFEAGLAAPSLSAWTYTGGAASFGTGLANDLRDGLPTSAAADPIQGVIIATESFGSWGNFSAGFNTGTSAETELVGPRAGGNLDFLGTLGGGQLNVGVAALFNSFASFLLQLNGTKVALEVQLGITAGLNLPDIQVILTAALNASANLDLLLSNFGISLNFLANIELLIAQIQLLIDLRASINLSGGGLSVWSYSGPANAMGAEFAAEVQNGLPNAGGPNTPVYGMAIATEQPSAWASFGLIFGV